MLGGRLQILADGEEIDIGGAQIVHHLKDLLARLAEADHHAGLGEHRRDRAPSPSQQPQRGEVARAGPDRRIEPRHGLEIVVEDVGPRRDHGLDRARLAQEVRASAPRSWCRARLRGCAGSPRRNARRRHREVVAVDRGDDDVRRARACRRPRRHCAGSCGSSAPGMPVATLQKAQARVQIVAQDHHRRVLLLPALADVRAGRLLADRVQACSSRISARGLVILRRARRLDPDPVRLALDRIVRPVRLLGMALARLSGACRWIRP